MIKTILIATDFSLESLDILKKVLKNKNDQNDENQYNILFVTGYDMGDSIRNLLFNSKSSIFSKIRPQEFCDAYSIINNKYPNLINKITCDIFTGSFQRTFNNYVEATEIHEAYYSSSKSNNMSKSQFDITPYVKKCKHLEAVEIMTQAPQFVHETGRLAEVFS